MSLTPVRVPVGCSSPAFDTLDRLGFWCSAEEPETVYRTGGDGTQRLSVVPTLRTAGSRAEPGPEVVSVKPGDGGSGNDSVMVPVMYGVTVLCITAVVVRRWQAAWFG